MYTVIIVFIIIACVLLVLSVLIQNPKGGGLSQTFGGIGNQILGVKQTTDLLERITWSLIGGVAGLCLITFFFVGKPTSTTSAPKSELQNINFSNPPANMPSNPAPSQGNNANPLDSAK